jgi:PAS domain S-box-containing protein
VSLKSRLNLGRPASRAPLDEKVGFVRRTNLQRYGFAVLTTLGATAITILIQESVGQIITPVFFAAVMASAWYGGTGPGLLTTTISVVMMDALLRGAPQFPTAAPSEMVRLIVFAVVAIATASIHSLWRQDKLGMLRVRDELEQRVEERTQQLVRLNQQLKAEIGVREEAEAEVRVSEERFRQLFEEAPVSYHEIDSEGIVRRVNRAECELLGRGPDQMIGRPVWEFVHPDARAASESAVRQKLADGKAPEPFVRPYRTADGRTVWFEIHERTIQDANGTVVGMRTAMLDITARKQAEDEIKRLNAELEDRVRKRTAELQRSNEDLQQFAYVVSHDLQEPLRVISGYAELLRRRYLDRLDSDANDFLGFMIDGSARMSRLIHDLLAYSRAGNAGRTEPVALSAVVDDALFNLRRAVEESGARVDWQNLPVVPGDRQRLIQLFQNLIGNAIKYRGEAPPSVLIRAEPDGQSWICSVSDNGIGFEQKYADRVFGVFRRLHGTTYPGTGIGLAIARRIVEQHGGRIWANSNPGQGSVFSFSLPASESPAQEAPIEELRQV